MLLAGISLLSYRRRTALLWKVEGSSLFLCFFLQTIIKTVDSNVQLYFHIFIYCHFFIGEINLEISKRFKRLLYAILHFTAENGAYLDLGWQESTVNVTINGKDAGLINLDRPRMDVSEFLVDGENTIELRLSTSLTNRMLSLGKQQAGVANLGMDFPQYINAYHEYGLTSVELIPYAQAVVE